MNCSGVDFLLYHSDFINLGRIAVLVVGVFVDPSEVEKRVIVDLSSDL
jgi:hypothetical protein